MEYHKEFQQWFNAQWSTYLNKQQTQIHSVLSVPEFNNYFHHVQTLSQKGKRLRPLLCALGYMQQTEGSYTDIQDRLVGLELFHTFCLIHDDIIDKARTRRGVQSMHVFASQEATHTNDYGASQAILVGDLLQGWALEALLTNTSTHSTQQVQAMVNEVVLGQMLDVRHTKESTVSESELTKKMTLKTASYTFVRPFLLGMSYAGSSTKETKKLEDWLIELGVTFQLQDDFLDVLGNPETTGKPVLNDLAEGQHTLILQQIFDACDGELRDELLKRFGTQIDQKTRHELHIQLQKLKIVESLKADIKERYTTHKAELFDLQLKPKVTQTLQELITYLYDRPL